VHYRRYGGAEPTKPTAYPIEGKSFAHGGEERNSFEHNFVFAISLEVDDKPSAQNSLQTNSFPDRQASIPCAVNASGSPQ
jgi:hypothetical protein